jgi:hypothetical protein
MRFGIGKTLIFTFVMLVIGANFAFGQDTTAYIEVRYEASDVWQWLEDGTCTPGDPVKKCDSSFQAEFYVFTNFLCTGGSWGFKVNRQLVRIDSCVLGSQLCVTAFAVFANDSVFVNGNDTTIMTFCHLGGTYFPGVCDTFFAPNDTILAATCYMTFKNDSIETIKQDSLIFAFDSTKIPPAGDFIFVNSPGLSVLPTEVVIPSVYLKYSKVDDIHPGMIPDVFELSQNYPNPFNPDTKIEFAISTKSFVNLTVYNIRGQKVRTLVDEELDVGWKSVTWDGRDNSGGEVASGVYLYKVVAGDFVDSKKMIMLK